MSSSSLTEFSHPCPENGYYDVFLSFRGQDTRYGFTANLYRSLQKNKVYTFMDIKLMGEDIDHLFKIVEKSRMAVVIYSKKFASSDWCLRELEMILQRMEEKKMLIIPIFYKVDFHELEQLSGKTVKYLDKHIAEHGETTVEKWKNTITNFGKVSGLSYQDTQDRDEHDFIAEVVVRIKEKLEEYDSFIQSPPHTKVVDELYRVVTSAYFQKSTEFTGDLLSIKPASVFFYVEPETPTSTCLILTNKTKTYVAFRIIHPDDQPLKYRVRPNEGLVSPHSTCQIIVTMQAQSVLPPDMECNDTFAVLSMEVKIDSISSLSLLDVFDMFNEESEDNIDEWSIGVTYLDSLEEDSSGPDHKAQLANKGLIHGASSVESNIDIHPTKPWLLFILESESVCIWDYKTRAEKKSFQVDDLSIWCANFIHEKPWIIVGADKGFVRVFNYNTSKKVKEFKAHEDDISCISVHPTSPYILTGSDDMLIKLWNWEKDWACAKTFEGHSQNITQVAFNPKDSRSFVSVSADGTIKIWGLDLSVAKSTINARAEGLNCVEYFVENNNKLYILSGSDDCTVGVWDYESKTLVTTLEGHSCDVQTTLVHPKLPIIITGSLDKTIRIWNKNTYRLELVWSCDLGQIWSMRFIKATDEVAIACEDGVVVIKVVDVGTLSD